MRKLITLFVAVVMMAGFTTNVIAQVGVSDSKSNQGRAEILGSITLKTEIPLEFGGMTLTDPALIGTVTLNPSSMLTPAKTNITSLGNILQTAAYYTLTGTPSTLYTITVPSTPVTLTSISTPANTMTVTNFTFASLATPSVITGGTLTSLGADAFYVGGKLNVNIGQAVGTYTGSFNVTVAY